MDGKELTVWLVLVTTYITSSSHIKLQFTCQREQSRWMGSKFHASLMHRPVKKCIIVPVYTKE